MQALRGLPDMWRVASQAGIPMLHERETVDNGRGFLLK